MEVKASLQYLRMTPRKIRMLTSILQGMDYVAAKHELTYRARRSAEPIMKLLDSAAASAQHNYGLVEENLFIKSIVVNAGPTLKRYKPKGFGSAMPIAKRTAHITVILDERVPGMKQAEKEDKKVAAQSSGAPREETSQTRTAVDAVPTGPLRRNVSEASRQAASAPQTTAAGEQEDIIKEDRKQKATKALGKKGKSGGFIRKVFNRKSI